MMMADDEDEVTFDQSTLLTNRLKPQSRKKWCLKLFKTAGVSLAFLALGLCIAIPGPTLLDLMERVNTDTLHITYIFTARSGGYLLGSILGGFLFDRFDQQLLLCVILFFTSIATAAAPWCQTLLALAVMISFQGISMGFLDTGGNIYCIQIWGKNSGPYMQTLHFCFGVGAFIAPLLAKPFLSAVAVDSSLNATSSGILHIQGGNIPLVMPQYGQPDGEEEGNRDPRSLPWNLEHIIARREVEVNLTGSSSPMLTTTLKFVPTTVKPKKPIASDDVLRGDTAEEDPTKHLREPDVLSSSSAASPTLPPQPSFEPTSVPNANQTDNNTASQGQNITGSAPLLNTSSQANIGSANPETSTVILTTPGSTTASKAPVTTPSTHTPTSSKAQSSQSTATVLSQTSTSTQKTSDNSSISVLPNMTVTPAESTVHPHKPLKAVGDIVQSTLEAIKHMSKIQFAYLIIAVFLLLSSVLFITLYCWEKRESVLTSVGTDEDRGEITESRGFRFQMLILLFIFYFMYVGMEVTYGGFVMTFAVQAIAWSKDRGTIVTAIFWGAMAAGRGMAIFVARCCRPSVMLIIHLVLTLVASVILSFGVSHYHYLLWAGTLILGLGLSAIFPTGLSWAERYMKLTGKATAVMVVGSALGEMCVPVITGYFFTRISLMSLMYIILAMSTVASVLFVIMQNLASNRGDRYSVSKFLKLDEGESMEMVSQGDDVEIFSRENNSSKRKRVKFNLDMNGTSYKPLRSSEEE
ncbi:sodium-dependent glucose transporter 1-like [Liolophura sinensis]|uniref:sodium-dependent glucose transporter 1-like n=1 Tax=Liolophura sinensis TaxID=3198878 RepID=UPI00315965D8